MLSPDAQNRLKMRQKLKMHLTVGLCLELLGELTALPRPGSYGWGGSDNKGRGKGGNGSQERKETGTRK